MYTMLYTILTFVNKYIVHILIISEIIVEYHFLFSSYCCSCVYFVLIACCTRSRGVTSRYQGRRWALPWVITGAVLRRSSRVTVNSEPVDTGVIAVAVVIQYLETYRGVVARPRFLCACVRTLVGVLRA